MRVLVLDNFDSFTYNLVDYFRQLGCTVQVYRNTVPLEALDQAEFDLLVLSPGPSVPRNAGNLMQVIERFYRTKPILGVCLGHQALIEFFGGTLANIAPVHGKSVPIRHDARGVFTGLEQDIDIARYHSWAADLVPSDLEVTARSADGVVMGIRHKRLPIEGIQFHPESVLSLKNNAGMRLLRNVVAGRLSAGNRIYHELARRLQSGNALDINVLREFLTAVEEGQLSDDQKQILLVSLSHRLRNAAELANFIEALRPAEPLPSRFADAVDICGTGGSNLPRINTSTLASLLLAHVGLPIAKHGNRAAAGRFGSFDLLERLGVPVRFETESAEHSLAHAHLAFIFAPDAYPVFRHFGPIRAKIGVPTVFNVLGPLVNPAFPRRQLIGTAFGELMDVIFETGIRMGKQHLLVVRGWDGLDEVSVSAPTRVLEYRNGQRSDYEIRPEDFGIEPLSFAAVSAHAPDECVAIAEAMLDGLPTTEHYQLVAANAAFAYTKFVEDISLREAYQLMRRLIFEGAMRESLERVRHVGRNTSFDPTASFDENPPNGANTSRNWGFDLHFLDRIVAHKQLEIKLLYEQHALEELRGSVQPTPRGFYARMAAARGASRPFFIFEFKRRSPSEGWIAQHADVSAQVRHYAESGASAVSVLTDGEFFGGSYADLRAARAALGDAPDAVLLLQKDFVLDPIQIFLARQAGADLILLIAAILPADRLQALREVAESLGMGVLVEVHDQAELDAVQHLDFPVLGVNNRDLRTFRTALNRANVLGGQARGRAVVAESGVHDYRDFAVVQRADGFLIGTSLMRQVVPTFGVVRGGLLKACGIRTVDLLRQVGLADFVGINFSPVSKRRVEESVLTEAGGLPEGAVAVFYKNSADDIREVLSRWPFRWVQVYAGDVSPEVVRSLRAKVILAVRVGAPADLEMVEDYASDVDFFILDGAAPGSGQGVPAGLIPTDFPYPFLLAGGIGADNALIFKQYKNCLGVDVASGIETDGAVDATKIAALRAAL
jgi:anthranilate synthase/phosphoribosyltransferase